MSTIKFSENAGYAVISVVDFQNSPRGACPRTPLDAPISPLNPILSPPTMPHLGEPWGLLQRGEGLISAFTVYLTQVMGQEILRNYKTRQGGLGIKLMGGVKVGQ